MCLLRSINSEKRLLGLCWLRAGWLSLLTRHKKAPLHTKVRVHLVPGRGNRVPYWKSVPALADDLSRLSHSRSGAQNKRVGLEKVEAFGHFRSATAVRNETSERPLSCPPLICHRHTLSSTHHLVCRRLAVCTEPCPRHWTPRMDEQIESFITPAAGTARHDFNAVQGFGRVRSPNE